MSTHTTPAPDVTATEETVGVLWSVRGSDFLYLIVTNGFEYDVHQVDRNTVQLVKTVDTMFEALVLIRAEQDA